MSEQQQSARAPRAVHRTAIFTLPAPTRHTRVVLDRAFAAYDHAYSELLYVAYLRFSRGDDLQHGLVRGLDALRGLATYGIDEKTHTPRMNARTLSATLYAGEHLPPRAIEALSRQPSRLRQSAREHAGQTLMSYVALADLWLARDVASRGSPPAFPQRLRTGDVAAQRTTLLTELAHIADAPRRERLLVTALSTTREPLVSTIPFVGVADDYGCGLYYSEDRHTFYARLDLLPPESRHAAPLDMPGIFTSIKTGVHWMSEAERRRRSSIGGGMASASDAVPPPTGPHPLVQPPSSFGRRRGMLWVPLLLDAPTQSGKLSYHERTLRFTERAAYLPHRGMDATHPLPAVPVSAKLVRRSGPSSQQHAQQYVKQQRRNTETKSLPTYEFHVTFAIPPEAMASAASPAMPREQRPILAINRGLTNLYAAVVLSADGRTEISTFVADGKPLLARTAALERTRQQRQQRGAASMTARDRRQARIAADEIAICANQIAEVARTTGAQVVLEDLARFASGAALRATVLQPRARQQALRTLLNRRQFQALQHAIDARLALLGLPPIITVSAAYISRTCITCGQRDTRTRAEQMAQQQAAIGSGAAADPRLFVCPVCTAHHHIDLLAATNIGRKLVWLRTRRAQKLAQTPEGERMGWDQFASALAQRAAGGTV